MWFIVQHVVRATPRADINSRQSKEMEEGGEGALKTVLRSRSQEPGISGSRN